MTIVYVQPPQLGSDYVVGANLTLARVPANRSWYASWIMLLPYGDAGNVPFAQVGLIRWAGSGYRLTPFAAYRVRGSALQFVPSSRVLPDGPHRATVARHGSQVTLYVDGVPYLSIDAATILQRGQSSYFQLGAEVYAQHDAVSGSIADITVRERGARVPYTPVCEYAADGLAFSYADGTWTAHGTFDANKPQRRVDPFDRGRSGLCENVAQVG